MNKYVYITLLLLVSAALLFGCAQTNPTKSPTASPNYTTVNGSLPWIEYEGHFYTKDIERAQNEIPFPIIVPTYLPKVEQQTTLPDIQGTLKQCQSDEIEIKLMYGFISQYEEPEILIIREANYSSSLGDPELNPQLEQITIQGISVVKTRDDWSPDTDAYYSFNSGGIFYIVETHNILTYDSNEIVESMIAQLQ